MTGANNDNRSLRRANTNTNTTHDRSLRLVNTNTNTPRSSGSTWTDMSTSSTFTKKTRCPSKMQLVVVAFERALDLLRRDVAEIKLLLKRDGIDAI